MAYTTDLTKPADLSLHATGTGHLRKQRPEYVDFMPPCNSACPAGENIQGWLDKAQAGNYFDAFQIIMEDNPFPAIMGRVCVRSCETGCNRNHIDTTVSIHAVERFIGDKAIEENWQPKFEATPSGKRVLVIGAGPSGLSAAYHLTRMGHAVVVYEADGKLGGLMRHGIPTYRLPANILDAEINRLANIGIRFEINHPVRDVIEEKAHGNFDAVYLAVGAEHIAKEDFAIDDANAVISAFDFLKYKQHVLSLSQKKVVVYGGGKLAMYIARIGMRLGAEVIVLFPGDRKLMPAYDYEADDALAEGVDLRFLQRIQSFKNETLEVEIMTIEKGKAVGTNTYENLSTDLVINAFQQEADTAFLNNIPAIQLKGDGTVVINTERMTGAEGIFAGGDVLPGEQRSVTIAIGHGKKAAKYIDGYIKNEPYKKPEKHATAGYRRLHMWYQTEAPKMVQDQLNPKVAIKSFNEVIAGLQEKEAKYEAQRCLSCGNCFECDGCYGACPEDAIIKLGPGLGYRFDLNACTGCAVCYEQCPCHAIDMIPEPTNAI